ncbi:glycosyl transferase [Sinisalibacter aestuarii]|uniref:Glycosyl transferase n=2 Tax=Sinisalibacter aestuarii TaxID=2949426 RepID=A0ABQ5LXI4_9RHOB|nr:glycosyl transferase [Sinisalibacter aestuarii]
MVGQAAQSGQGRLVAVVVTYNRLAQLRVTLPRLLEAAPEALQAVVVVDNASTDGTGDWLRGQDDGRLHAILSPDNLGGAGGFNLGMRRAVEMFDPDWLVVMDDDARPAPEALAAFHAADLRGWDAVAAAVYYPDGAICDMNRPAMNPFRDAATFLRYAGGQGDVAHLTPADYAGDARRVDWSTFVGLFLSRRAMQMAGYPDPRLFIYADDVLFTLGLTRAGGQIGFLPEIRFEHDCSSLAGGSSRRLHPFWKTYYYHRNQIFLYRALAGRWFWPVILLLVAKWTLKVRHHKGQRGPFLKLLWWAVRDGLTGRRDMDPAIVFRAAGGG